ncbi:MAG: hypothetical protein ABSG18_19745 [Steroidobacteraceae bacterium]|jgi:hypothetical protein
MIGNAFSKAKASFDVVDAYFTYLKRAQQRGYGGEDAARVFDVLAPDVRRVK